MRVFRHAAFWNNESALANSRVAMYFMPRPQFSGLVVMPEPRRPILAAHPLGPFMAEYNLDRIENQP